MLAGRLCLLLWTIVVQASAGPVDDLSAAKALYDAGSYEEALTRLSTLHADTMIEEADEYRALCQLALGHPLDAQRTLDDLVRRAPLFRMSETEMSPRLVAMFHDARRRQLSTAARTVYESGKASFDQKNYAAASAQLKMLLTVLADDDLADQAATLSDLKMLGEGFLKLAEAAQDAPKPAPPPVATAPKAPEAVLDKIYTSEDKDVTPPVDISRPFPDWHPMGFGERLALHGVIRVIVNANGTVDSASLPKSVFPTYDPLLLAASKDWTFHPAMRNGQPVRYIKFIPFSLLPR